MSYEKNKEELENLLDSFEDTKSLKESLVLYEKGVKLAEQCLKELNELKGKFEVVNSSFEKQHPIGTNEDFDIDDN